ncbi:Ig-like domain-containing protein [Streptomyces sp. CBMA152]|uniref:L,D-transpeptidase n=1 Tax=Streptomyces sp. CBMA152 TaxID=1896312 RepID=UPI001660E875|nr:Ig-like domain-containing protein [Streptomyces sp. CBMA152]MBD0742283.1 hypothetical protein [Streptomyces sp. CBMA152]
MSRPTKAAVLGGGALLAALLGQVVTACGGAQGVPRAEPRHGELRISIHGHSEGQRVDPGRPLEVTARGSGGRMTDVTVVDTFGRRLAGRLDADGTHWRAATALAAATHYTVHVATEDDGEAMARRTLQFETSPAGRVLSVRFGPGPGTYGVGQPITAKLGTPVRGARLRALVEGALKVESSPAAEGAWHWVDDTTLHYRPRTYWPAHAVIQVRDELNGAPIADDLYGGETPPLVITTGARIEAVVDAAAHSMTVRRDGTTVKTVPVTTGRPGFGTRNGVKVVLGREYVARMRGASVGIPPDSPDAYDQSVRYAVRITLSGEYLHAAPWSQGSQGHANVSHGCVGMGTRDAAWFFRTVREGDIVRVIHSHGKKMPAFGNGFGDWNLSWNQWRRGSALSERPTADPQPTGSGRLRPQL